MVTVYTTCCNRNKVASGWLCGIGFQNVIRFRVRKGRHCRDVHQTNECTTVPCAYLSYRISSKSDKCGTYEYKLIYALKDSLDRFSQNTVIQWHRTEIWSRNAENAGINLFTPVSKLWLPLTLTAFCKLLNRFSWKSVYTLVAAIISQGRPG